MTYFYKLNAVFKERERVERLSLIRELIFGAQDGLIAPLAIIATISGAFVSKDVILITGISASLAGALTLGTGTYLASQAEQEVLKSEIRKEKRQINRDPKREREELILMFEAEGLSYKNAEIVVDKILTSKKSFQNTQIQKELGLDPLQPGNPVRDGIYTSFAALLCSLIPLSPFFFIQGFSAMELSTILSLCALFMIGVIKGQVATINPFKSGLQVLFLGLIADIGGLLLGKFLPQIIHFS